MKPIPGKNPPNRFSATVVEWDEEPPLQGLEVIEDHSRSILAHNDSPDLGFSWSLNPYRGCQHACAYCVSGDTPILMGDGRARALMDVRVGDEIYGTERRGVYRRYAKTRVLAHWSVVKPAYRVELADGTVLVASGDHRFLTLRGWKHVVNTPRGAQDRAHLTLNNELLGVGRFAAAPADNSDYRRGFLCGVIRGDALLRVYRYPRRSRGGSTQHQFRVALTDFQALNRARDYLMAFEVPTREAAFGVARAGHRPVRMIRTHSAPHFARIRELIEWPTFPSDHWRKGFLAGIFDAEGSTSCGVFRISNKDLPIIHMTGVCLHHFGFDRVTEVNSAGVMSVRIRGGAAERLRFFHLTDPAITRKRSIEGLAVKHARHLRVVSIEPLPRAMRLFDITTGTEDFIANGVISHNCYARPTHEYLGYGTGVDFDRKIVVKPRAAALLRETFDAPKWQGELVLVSGNTDCYQPLERKYELTRRCLEVFLEYKNPLHIITKGPLVERDIDLLVELAKVTRAGVTVSIPFWNLEHSRAIEAGVATPQRRIETVRRLAAAGINVTVNVAPVIPGLSDRDIPEILRAAADAGARRAAMILLRLPGSVKQVFEERLREKLPLAADKVLARTREVRGGRLNDPSFGSRMTGKGEYAEVIRALFEKTARRFGISVGHADGAEEPAPTTFRRPTDRGGQLRMLD